MKVLIQDGRNKKFFNAIHGWVSDAREGDDFKSHDRAYAVAQQSSAAEFNIVLFSPVARYAFSIDHVKSGLCKPSS